MIGDASDMQRRLRVVLPAGWFGDDTPVLNQMLLAIGSGFAAFWKLLQNVIARTRIASASGDALDSIAADFFGSALTRFPDEQDDAFRARITTAMLRPRGTRAAVANAMLALTGQTPIIFEPARTTDTGGYSTGGVGYGSGGGWGSLALPFQFFITVFRPAGGGIAQLAGYGSGGIPVYGSLAMQVAGLPDAVLQAAIPPLLPAATIAWTRIANPKMP